jgi:Tfp pilus assembly PilM family ATPase
MARSFPADVIVLDADTLVHARLARGKKDPQLVQTESYRLAGNTFLPAVVTPQLANESSLADALRRLRVESGRWDRASVLLPDSWFRVSILELPSLPEGAKEAQEMIRWSLKRIMPIDPALLRVSYNVLARTPSHTKVLVLSAIDETLCAIEKVFAAAGIEVVLIEPIGINIWNAITAREGQTSRDRIFFYIRDGEFTTAAFRGAQPLFIRSCNLNSERTLEQEIKLSASYLRDTLRTEAVELCYVAGNAVNGTLTSVISTEFAAPVRKVALEDLTERRPEGTAAHEAELAACTGVFTS